MIEEQGRVVAVEEGTVWIETERKSTCSSCSAKNGCGQHLADKYRTKNTHSYIRATSALNLVEGSSVVVGIPEAALMKASVLAYLLPLLFMMAAIWGVNLSGMHELVAIPAALAGLTLGFVPAKILGGKASDICKVKVIRQVVQQHEPELIPVHQSWSV
ncbi:transcriptional regulator [Endozoicomonas sp. OPT23]|uniref:SoxR reducing system RseC family protein n=1 Tax=Endozoicomonas sp. OPT23 TaxID=2072845 RepID=UPI00129C091E|nr:SoxR reducing system RseC family protein [Endozoicomonas sp. OPT23]MRI34877.1 transcriptional regulator [Endozoicomonas sp. OPT23]